MVELLRDETKKIVCSLDVEFETSLKEAYPRNLKAVRERVIKENVRVIKENVHLAESLRRYRNKKWRKFEGRGGANREKLEGNSDRLTNETKSEVSAQAETQMVPSQRHVFSEFIK